MSHTRSSKAQKEYVKAMIQSLSLQRLTDQEIADYLHNEKRIDVARSTISGIRIRMEKQAAKWYIELRQSTSKYIAAYKQRIDSLLSYQKKLHEIIAATKKDEVKIRAISELHSIEMDIFYLWKQLPSLEIADQIKQEEQEQEGLYKDEYMPAIDEADERERFDKWSRVGKPMSEKYREDMETKYGVLVEPWSTPSFVQCPSCKRWFRNGWILTDHEDTCIEKLNEPIV